MSFASIAKNLAIGFFPLVIVLIFRDSSAFLTAALLVLLEVSLSFDNAVINAKVLMRMTPVWQARFLTWGILIAVFGTRLVLPILIVSAAAGVSPITITLLALFDAHAYGEMLHEAHGVISAFGGIFLLMVAMKYFINDSKEEHWIESVEKRLAKWGHIESVEIGIAIAISLVIAAYSVHPFPILVAGILGVLVFIMMQALEGAFSATSAAAQGIILFLYLNVLDSSFSLDGVVAAFALTNDLLTIVVGLGVGAYFVRSLTISMVKHNTLHTLVYLEHGAHWAVFGLAIAMLAAIFVEVPELLTAGVGVCFIAASYFASIQKMKA